MREAKALAANQGLYNLFLAAGLVWGLYLGDAGFAIKVFFLACVIVAGLFGAATVGGRILYVQAVPAALALTALYEMGYRTSRKGPPPWRCAALLDAESRSGCALAQRWIWRFRSCDPRLPLMIAGPRQCAVMIVGASRSPSADRVRLVLKAPNSAVAQVALCWSTAMRWSASPDLANPSSLDRRHHQLSGLTSAPAPSNGSGRRLEPAARVGSWRVERAMPAA